MVVKPAEILWLDLGLWDAIMGEEYDAGVRGMRTLLGSGGMDDGRRSNRLEESNRTEGQDFRTSDVPKPKPRLSAISSTLSYRRKAHVVHPDVS